ncbi:response regulator [Paenibacillus beijingensis]|uniref:AraC family transcriptional regulator n=1 Tax=Paenibacillus beijingensis TaxID=1126833 RepID=A0A0D5NIS5_9BACL|nr:response regulator [Paenibacillus beijingensis]AJY75156.1 hypothetical protein VN24_11920 [Paenibacillus beijingensis]
MIKAVIVDDDRTTIDGLTRAVRWDKFGIEVAGTAINGKEGLKQIRAHGPAIILTDLFMPVMDGIEMLKALREEGNRAEVIILSGYEDFKYAQSAVKLQVNDYLSKPATLDEIERVLKETADKIKQKEQSEREDQELRELLEINLSTTKRQMFKGLLEPGFCRSAFFRKVSDYLKIDWSDCFFTVLVIEFFISRELNRYRPSDLSQLAYKVWNMADDLSQCKEGVYVADIQRNFITLIVTTPAHMKPEAVQPIVKQTALEFLESIRNRLKLQAYASVGSAAERLDDIPQSYSAAVDLLAERDKFPDQPVMTGEDREETAKEIWRRPMESYQQIVDAVMSGQEELARERIEELAQTLYAGSMPSISALREFAIDIAGLLALALHDHRLQIEDIHPGFNMYKVLEHLHTVDDFHDCLRDLLLPVCGAISSRSSQKHRKTIDFIMRYVQEHYAEDITLDVLAEKVYLTRNYLSQIFKQRTGENYNSYLTRIRMEKAKELMLEGNYKIFEISQMVGYKNNAYFSQLFKKYTGYNPSEFNQ